MENKKEEKKVFRLNDDISFRKCSLFEGKMNRHGDCTSFLEKEENWKTYYECQQYGIHLHCTRHPAIELDHVKRDFCKDVLVCPKCRKEIEIDNFSALLKQCMKLLNTELFKDAALIRLDDWYVPEVKEKVKTESGYWISTNVKTDKDGETIVVVYIGHKDQNEKVQYFIKPEKMQLTNDHKDLDPAQIISKIEVVLKDRILRQEYD